MRKEHFDCSIHCISEIVQILIAVAIPIDDFVMVQGHYKMANVITKYDHLEYSMIHRYRANNAMLAAAWTFLAVDHFSAIYNETARTSNSGDYTKSPCISRVANAIGIGIKRARKMGILNFSLLGRDLLKTAFLRPEQEKSLQGGTK